jgi:translocator protein
VRGSGLVAAGVVVVVLAYAVLATRWISADPGWYAGLAKPAWQPPDWVFGVAWPYNFVALGVTGVALALQHPGRVSTGWLLVLAVSVGFALGWAQLFYVPPHRLVAAAVSLGLAAALSWLLVGLAGRTQAWTGWLLLPYAVWMTVATSLSIGFAGQ